MAISTASLATACLGDAPSFLGRGPIAEVPHHGYRRDIPADRRGNATFEKAVFMREGGYLVTLGRGIRVRDARTGALLRIIDAALDGNDQIVADGARHRLLARRADIAPNRPDALGLAVWDLRDGSIVGTIPETFQERAIPVGTTPSGHAVVFRERKIELWALDGSGRTQVIAPPEGRRFCQRGVVTPATCSDRDCFELSPSVRWLAVNLLDRDDQMAPPMPHLVDLQEGSLAPIPLPAGLVRLGTAAFAFSSDERLLALTTWDGLWIWHRDSTGTPADGSAGGRFIAGQHQRNQMLVPMAFTAGDTRLVALGDQLQVDAYDVVTGKRIGRTEPPFGDFEGALRVSADGSRAVAYRFLPDILVVIDGATGAQRGYVCPYFCNRLHQPVAVPYAVSPDGRRVATGGRLGAGLWDTDADTLIAPLADPSLPPLGRQ